MHLLVVSKWWSFIPAGHVTSITKSFLACNIHHLSQWYGLFLCMRCSVSIWCRRFMLEYLLVLIWCRDLYYSTLHFYLFQIFSPGHEWVCWDMSRIVHICFIYMYYYCIANDGTFILIQQQWLRRRWSVACIPEWDTWQPNISASELGSSVSRLRLNYDGFSVFNHE